MTKTGSGEKVKIYCEKTWKGKTTKITFATYEILKPEYIAGQTRTMYVGSDTIFGGTNYLECKVSGGFCFFPSDKVLSEAEIAELCNTVTPDKPTTASSKVTWVETAMEYEDGDGSLNLTAHKAGEATITIEGNGASTSFQVIVKEDSDDDRKYHKDKTDETSGEK